MSFSTFKKKEMLLLFVGTAILKALQVSGGDLHLTCSKLVNRELAVCNCSIDLKEEFPLFTTCSLQGEGNLLLERRPGVHSKDSAQTSARRCVCCFENMELGFLKPSDGKEVADTKCSVKVWGSLVMLQAVFLVSKTLHGGSNLTCVSPCLGKKDSLFLDIQDSSSASTMSMLLIVIVAVGSAVGGIVLMLLVLVLGVRYQRKQAWVVRDNKQSGPGPLPCLQNSGLVYEVDKRGLVVPVTTTTDKELSDVKEVLSTLSDKSNTNADTRRKKKIRVKTGKGKVRWLYGQKEKIRKWT